MERKDNILIVDDEPSAREILRLQLSQEKNYELIFATNGVDVLDHMDDLEPDVILLDVMMPGLSGFEVCKRIKANENWKHIPIIIITALDGKSSVVAGLEAGADDVLRKPIDGEELKGRIRSMLRIKKQFDALNATLHLREDLANMMVHDMKNSLTTIMYYSEFLIQAEAVIPKFQSGIETIHTEAHRLNSFINDLLLVAKMEEGKMILNRSLVDINEFVLSVKRTYDTMAQARDIHLEVIFPEETEIEKELDHNLFQRLLDNLLSNALKFSPPESTITLEIEYPIERETAKHPHSSLRFKVRDEGPGIPQEHRANIFNKFETVASKEIDSVPQMGLGLTLCKMVAEAHEGSIYIEDNEPTGAVFVVEI